MTTPHKEITSGLKFPEGPIAMEDGSVILVEIARETLTRVMPDGKQHIIAKLGGEQVIAVFRERHQFNPGDKVRLKPDPSLVHLFDDTTGKRLNA